MTILTATPTVASIAGRRQHPPDVRKPASSTRLRRGSPPTPPYRGGWRAVRVVELQPQAVHADDDADAEEQQQSLAVRPCWPRAWRRCWPAARARRPAEPDTAAAKSFHPAVNQFGRAWVVDVVFESGGGPTADRTAPRIESRCASASRAPVRVGRSVARELLANGHKILSASRLTSGTYEPTRFPGRLALADACELSSLEECGMQRATS